MYIETNDLSEIYPVYCYDEYVQSELPMVNTWDRKDKFLYPNKIKKINLRQRRWRGNKRESKKQYYELKK